MLKDSKEENRVGVMYALQELIPLDYPDPKKMYHFSNYLRNALTQTSKWPVVELVTRTVGCLAKQSMRSLKTTSVEWIDFETKRALEWLQEKDLNPHRGFVASLVLMEFAQNSETLFFPYVNEFFTHIWHAVFHNHAIVRDSARQAIRGVLTLLAHRGITNTSDVYRSVYSKIKETFKTEKTETIHGCILTISELLQQPNLSTSTALDPLCEQAIEHMNHKDPLIRSALVNFIPILAKFEIRTFCSKYLDNSMKFLFSQGHEQGEVYISLGNLTLEVAKEYPVQFIALDVDTEEPVDFINPVIFDLKNSPSSIINSPLSPQRTVSQAVLPATPQLKYSPVSPRATDNSSTQPFGTPVPSTSFRRVTDTPPLRLLTSKPTSSSEKVLFQETDVKIKIDKNPSSQPMIKYLKLILHAIRDGLQSKRNKELMQDILSCLGMVCKALGNLMYEHVLSLLGLLLKNGLSTILVATFTQIVTYIPKLLVPMQERVLDSISHILARSSLHQLNTHIFFSSSGNEEGREKFIVALKSLRDFNTQGIDLVGFLKGCVIKYMDDENTQVRTESIITCSQFASRPGFETIIGNVVEKLLVLGITDQNTQVRLAALQSMTQNFDEYLSNSPNLSSLFITLNDDSFKVRQVSISLIGRLSTYSPSTFLPSLRKLLLQFLTKLELSKESKTKEELILALGNLIVAVPSMISSYSEKIIDLLIKKMKEEDPTVASHAFDAAAKLCTVCGKDHIKKFFKILFETIISSLHEFESKKKKRAGLLCISKLISYSGNVIKPYFDYPNLLETLLTQIQTETDPTIRVEIIRVMGYLGAIDPNLSKSQNPIKMKQNDVMGLIPGIDTSIDNYYPSVVLNTLLKILKDFSISMHHEAAIQCLMFVITTLNKKLSPFLAQLVEPFVTYTLSTHDNHMRIQMLQNLCSIVSISSSSIEPFAEKVLNMVVELWYEHIPECIRLTEELAIALKHSFAPFVPKILPFLLEILESGETNSHLVIKALIIFRHSLVDYLDIVIPAILKLLVNSISIPVRTGACQAIREIALTCNIFEYSARIIHSLCKVICHKEMQGAIMETFCCLVVQMKSDYVLFISLVSKHMIENHIVHKKYDELIHDLLESRVMIPYTISTPSVIKEDHNPSHDDDKDIANEKRMYVNQLALKKAWSSDKRATAQDWNDWFRQFSIGLLSENPCPLLRSCSALAQVYLPISRELFNAAFLSIWKELDQEFELDLIKSIEFALGHSTLPQDLLQILLNLVEFMQHQEDPLPISNIVGSLATKVGSFAKALHFREMQYLNDPSIVEELIPLYHRLDQPKSALGLMNKLSSPEINESWFELLSKWNEANDWYEKKRSIDNDTKIAHLKCLQKLEKWDRLLNVCSEAISHGSEAYKNQVSNFGLMASLKLEMYDSMKIFFDHAPCDHLYKAIYFIHKSEYHLAYQQIDKERQHLNDEIFAICGEGYPRIYRSVVKAQQLSELEEIIDYKTNCINKTFLMEKWTSRLDKTMKSVDVLSDLLSIHPIALTYQEEIRNHLDFAKLCRDSHLFDSGKEMIQRLISKVGLKDVDKELILPELIKFNPIMAYEYIMMNNDNGCKIDKLNTFVSLSKDPFSLSKGYRRLGVLHKDSIEKQYEYFKKAIEVDPSWVDAWHGYALCLSKVLEKSSSDLIGQYLPITIHSFFKTISLKKDNIEDILRLLAVYFDYGEHEKIVKYFLEGKNMVSVDSWLKVIPQLLARLNTTNENIRKVVIELLLDIGRAHPHALAAPLILSSQSSEKTRKEPAERILNEMKNVDPKIIDANLLVNQELIRIAILWAELFHENLEEAYKLFQKQKYTEMCKILNNLTNIVSNPETTAEFSFSHIFGRDIQEGWEWCSKYLKDGHAANLSQAWEVYYAISTRCQQMINSMKSLDLKYISEKLYNAMNLDMCVPGTYSPGDPIIKIHYFDQYLDVIDSKQKPRKLRIIGSNGKIYQFLLKGHEDLRLDERCHQLFELVNNLFLNHRETSKDDLSITSYSVLVLSQNVGLIGWVPNTETLHGIITKYRTSRNIAPTLEYMILKNEVANYDVLPLFQKLEVFEYVLENTSGQDLHRIFWLHSKNSEIWLERRTNYTKSLAVMSIVGYILGLGDRHPRNLMIDDISGRVVHVDFGDCFEVAMNRDVFPEKVPFRLTRMLIQAMEVCGINGNFLSTCENVMGVMRKTRDPVMAMLEAFVHDPLVNWRLVEGDQVNKVDVINEKANKVIDRIHSKLNGTEFGETASVQTQVKKLIDEATDHLNLCQAYLGWSNYW